MIGANEILRLGYSVDGTPYCNVASGSINPNSLGFSEDGSPWWGHSGGSITIIVGNIKRVSKVNWGYIKKVTTVTG